MSRVWKCDACGVTVDDMARGRWLQLKALTGEATEARGPFGMLVDEPGVLTFSFCSVACLSTFGNIQAVGAE